MHSSVKHCRVLAHQHFIHEGRDSINWGRLIILKSSYQWKEKIWGSFHVLHQRPASHRDVRRLQEVRWSTQQLLRMSISPITFPIQRNLAIVRASTTYLLIFFIGNWHYCFPPTHSFKSRRICTLQNSKPNMGRNSSLKWHKYCICMVRVDHLSWHYINHHHCLQSLLVHTAGWRSFPVLSTSICLNTINIHKVCRERNPHG